MRIKQRTRKPMQLANRITTGLAALALLLALPAVARVGNATVPGEVVEVDAHRVQFAGLLPLRLDVEQQVAAPDEEPEDHEPGGKNEALHPRAHAPGTVTELNLCAGRSSGGGRASNAFGIE